MKVFNVHERVVNQPKEALSVLLSTLATEQDKVWPQEHWPPMRFAKGLQEGAHGGHGPIRYFVKSIVPNERVEFQFTQPTGFHGTHYFDLLELNDQQTRLRHVIEMNVVGKDSISWRFITRWLHDALAEDALDKVANYFSTTPKKTKWNIWVRLLRKGFAWFASVKY